MHVSAGETKDGVIYAKNICPGQGTMDVFVEPVLPRPNLIIFGGSPVAVALADIGRRMGFFITVCAPLVEHSVFGGTGRLIDGFTKPTDGTERGFVVIATQVRGDSSSLKAIIYVPAKYYAFVGSRKKAAALKSDLHAAGIDPYLLDKVRAPAGLNIGAITPDEIAFSIVAEMIEINRRGQRPA